MRKAGFYFVIYKKKWTIAQWVEPEIVPVDFPDRGGYWLLTGTDQHFTDRNFTDLGPGPLTIAGYGGL